MSEEGDESSFSEKREELVRRGSEMSILKSGDTKEVDYLPSL